MTTLCICVYNRIENIQHWIDCLKLCPPVRTVVIHNHYNEPGLSDLFRTLCEDNNIHYIPRNGPGFDIGAFQDVCTGRIDMGEWGRLLWCCDDTLPMALDFIQQFENSLVGVRPGRSYDVACMQISPYVQKHIRTTGFMITREAAQRLIFPADPVQTKEDCYQFEHRSFNHFLSQVKAVQVAPNETSPLWDVGYHRRLDRLAEHVSLFGEFADPGTIEQKETVTFICPIYKEFPAIISCLIQQTNRNWKLWLVHNGPSVDGAQEAYVNLLNDDRITWEEKPDYTGNYGHATRAEWLQKVTSKYVVISNPDNYYVPSFIEKCLNVFTRKGRTVGVYSQQIIHNYTGWQVMNCRMVRGYVDCGSVMLKTKEVQQVGWNHLVDHSSDWLFFNDLIKRYGLGKFLPVSGCLFVHN